MKTRGAELFNIGKEKISSITVLSQIKVMLEEDVKVLESINQHQSFSKSFKMLLTSLINAKKKMLKLINEPYGVFPEAVAPPQRKGVSSHKMSSHANFEDEISMCSMFYKIESDQMNYVRHQLYRKGIPTDIYHITKKILGMYTRIESQLKRIVKTKQIFPLRS